MSKDTNGESERTALVEALDHWHNDVLTPLLHKAGKRKTPATFSEIPVKPLYTPLDVDINGYQSKIGFPGEYPFTRGIHPTMYLGRPWSMRQYAGFGTPEESNARFKYLLEQGQTGLSVAFDLPTQIGYDSDNPLAHGEVGKVGVAIDSLEDMEKMLEGIPLDRVSTSMTINAPTAILLAMYVAVAEKQGVPLSKLSGTVQNDILKEYIARGTYIFPPQHSLRLMVDTFRFCINSLPNWNMISIGGYHIREAGSNAVQEIAFAFANAIEYLTASINAGLDIDRIGPRISWIFNTQNDFFEEVAKYRAARRLWARIMREDFQAKDPRSWMFRTHVQDGGSTLTAQQPLNNIVRSTLHALATVLGGIQSMALCSYDEALSIPTEEAAMLSLRIQQIIAHEGGITSTIDPLAGSYFLETLTLELEQRIVKTIEEIKQQGGAARAIETGYMAQEIQKNAYRQQKEIESKERIVVGVNEYQTKERPTARFSLPDLSVENAQIARLTELRQRRNSELVARALNDVRTAAVNTADLMPPIIAAVKAYATLGEICDVLRAVFGEYKVEGIAS